MTVLSYKLKKEPAGILRARIAVCIDGPVRRLVGFYLVRELMSPFPLDRTLKPGFEDFRVSMLMTGMISKKQALSFVDINIS